MLIGVEMHTSHTYFKWQTNWYKCTAKTVKKLAWKIKQKMKKNGGSNGISTNEHQREQKPSNEKHFVYVELGWGQCACMHKATYLQPFVRYDCRHRLALHNSFKDVWMKMHPMQCNGTRNIATPFSLSHTVSPPIHNRQTCIEQSECKRVQFYYPMLCTIVKRAQSRFVISS